MGTAASIQEANVLDEAMKPDDASDIKDLEAAKAEIVRVRKLCRDFAHRGTKIVNCTNLRPEKEQKKQRRGDVLGDRVNVDLENYEKKIVPKSNDQKAMITKSLQTNVLFRHMPPAELADMVDAFFEQTFGANETIIQQGDKGDNLYVLETGELAISVKQGDLPDVMVGSIAAGSSFGELALMYNQPRAATVTTTGDVTVWTLRRQDYIQIAAHFKLGHVNGMVAFLKHIPLLQVLSEHDVRKVAMAMDTESYEPGETIIREGEVGNHFYIVEKGEVEVTVKGQAVGEPLTAGAYFGERALLNQDVRAATCRAAGQVDCLTLDREVFTNMLGSINDLTSTRTQENAEEQVASSRLITGMSLEKLEVQRTLGCGAFGRVKLVKESESGKVYALKCQAKKVIVENNLEERVLNEHSIMVRLDHPFIVRLYSTFQDDRYMYFLLEFLQGGELFTVLRNHGNFKEKWAKFYTASVIVAFDVMHKFRIAYRDLKPENLVLDSRGYCKVVDFGLASRVPQGSKTWTLCGTPDYLAPEIILNHGHDLAVDYWALGVLTFELLAGFPPFYARDPMEVYERILSGEYSSPSHIGRSSSDLIRKLLQANQSKRLGNTKGGINAIKSHKWFSGFNWDGLLAQEIPVPVTPEVGDAIDAANFDEYPEESELSAVSTWNPELPDN